MLAHNNTAQPVSKKEGKAPLFVCPLNGSFLSRVEIPISGQSAENGRSRPYNILQGIPRRAGRKDARLCCHCMRWAHPRYAGKYSSPGISPQVCRDHPRVRGEKRGQLKEVRSIMGSPPRARGEGGIMATLPQSSGITPACAGRRNGGDRKCLKPMDHPRVRGEKILGIVDLLHQVGSPPRARGEATLSVVSGTRKGITPACAGRSPVSSRC